MYFELASVYLIKIVMKWWKKHLLIVAKFINVKDIAIKKLFFNIKYDN